MKKIREWLDEWIINHKKLTKICVVNGCSETGEARDDNDNYICSEHCDKFSRS